jgi:hypothetical protein
MMLVNCGYGRLNSNRDSVGLVKRGRAFEAGHLEERIRQLLVAERGLPPCVTSH